MCTTLRVLLNCPLHTNIPTHHVKLGQITHWTSWKSCLSHQSLCQGAFLFLISLPSPLHQSPCVFHLALSFLSIFVLVLSALGLLGYLQYAEHFREGRVDAGSKQTRLLVCVCACLCVCARVCFCLPRHSLSWCVKVCVFRGCGGKLYAWGG